MIMRIERARQDDLAEVAALWHAGWHQAHADIVPPALVASRQPAEFEARAAKRLSATWVARAGGGLAGFYMLEGDELYQFYVDARFQGRGVAGSMMAAVERDLTGRVAWLACSVGNDRAARFYEKAGWRREAEEVYPVESAEGTQEVIAWRFEKDLR
ncbi:MAG: GNAT family N-acetyltransferase [Sulfitobacter sp.]|nr:GNAT family N-acetyltransferase [Sulfitobacter sp.]